MMASYRFALFCNRSCSPSPSLSPYLLWGVFAREGGREAALRFGDHLCAKSSRLCLWAMLKNWEGLLCRNAAFLSLSVYEHANLASINNDPNIHILQLAFNLG